MKKIYILLFIGVLFMMKAQGQIITSGLQTELDNAAPSDLLAITITMSEQYDVDDITQLLENMTREERRQLVVNELKSFADASQQVIMNTITGLEALGQVENVRQFWIVNMIACKAKPAAINQLAQRQDISMMHIDEIYEIGEIGTDNDDCLENPPGIPYHIDAMNVPAVWDLGYEGEDVVVAVLDTGVDYWHPDLEGNMWEDPVTGYYGKDFIDNDDDPMEHYPFYHGTYIAGMIAGKGTEGCKTGVAPKAKIMAVRIYDNEPYAPNYFHSTGIQGVEWSVEHGADILSLSIGHWILASGHANLIQWRITMNNVLASGRLAVVAAGNLQGDVPNPSIPNQIFVPGNVPPPWKHPVQNFAADGGQSAVVCVGAIDQDNVLWDTACQGPVTWHSNPPWNEWNDYPWNSGVELSGLLRPDVVAPGVNIVSLHSKLVTYPSPHWVYCYIKKTGTSMSAPAVAGVMALMLSKNPHLTPSDLDEIIEMTAYHPSNFNQYRYKDNQIGSGSVRADLAVAAVPECELVIEDNQTLNDTIFYCDIIVKPGGTLTINQNLWFARNRKIIIEPGGKLIVDGAKISRLNNEMWQGIEVWGNSTANQLPNAQGNYAQGYVNLNNATIENALTAVNLWKPDDLTKTGGILIANNTVFRNNSRAVHALNYTNYIHNQEMEEVEIDYVATFTRCSFEIDVNYPGAETFEKHVELSEVRGVKFLACEFSLISSTAINVSDVNVGIESNSAGFRVDAICTSSTIPCSSYDSCTFTGFHKAIDAKVTRSTTRTFYVNRAQFHGNAYGIHVNSINNFIVLNSEFHIGFNAPEMDQCDSEGKSASGYGIFTSNCTGFAIEENYFTKKAGSANWPIYTGILLNNCPSLHDIIYKNEFTGLSYANYAQGTNRQNPGDDEHGVEYQCNLNTGNSVDFIVTGDEPDEAKIRTYQGLPNLASGNTFSSAANWHYRNEGEENINYYFWYGDPNQIPDMQRVYSIDGLYFDDIGADQNTCPSHYGGGGGGSGGTDGRIVLTAGEKLEREQTYLQNLSDYQSVKALFVNLKDGGDTEALQSEIEMSWPQDMWELRAKLLGKSPHLSKDVLMTAADKTIVLPESILFEILAANPDELKKADLLRFLEEKDQPLPEYMIDILKQLSFGVTYKTILKRQMAGYHAGKTQAASDMIRSILADTVLDMQQYRNWLDKLSGMEADKQIIASFLTEGNCNNAQALLNLLPSLYALEGQALLDYNDYKALMQMQMTWQQQGRNIFELDSAEVAVLVDFAEHSAGEAKYIARGILTYAYDYHYCECLADSDSSFMKSRKEFPTKSLDTMFGLEVTVNPNPAGDWTSFVYQLSDNSSNGIIEITDVTGSVIERFNVSGIQGQKVWDTRKIKAGVYFYTLNVSGNNKTGKIVIHK